MRFMDTFNRFTGKWMPLIVLLCLTAGIVFSDSLSRLTFLVPYIFAFMTFTGALNSSFRQIFSIARHPLPLFVSFVVLHAVIPLLALGFGKLFFPGNPNFITGIVLEYVVPSAVASVMWCTLAGGDTSLTLSILLVDTLTAPFVLPFSLSLLVGAHAQIDIAGMMSQLLWMVTIPALLTMAMNQFTHNRAGKKLSPVMAPYGKIALILIITINSTRVAPFVRNLSPVLFGVTAAIFVLAVSGYSFGLAAAFALKQNSSVTASMTFGCGMRNISAGAVIAATYFPAEVMFPVMIGTLFQQALASIFSFLLTKLARNKKDSQSDSQF